VSAYGLIGIDMPGFDPIDNGFGGNVTVFGRLKNCEDIIHQEAPLFDC
jgi:hypothetical protein